MAKFKFSVENKYQKARAGSIETFHGKIKTPVFMPVGTLGSVKAIFQRRFRKTWYRNYFSKYIPFDASPRRSFSKRIGRASQIY